MAIRKLNSKCVSLSSNKERPVLRSPPKRPLQTKVQRKAQQQLQGEQVAARRRSSLKGIKTGTQALLSGRRARLESARKGKGKKAKASRKTKGPYFPRIRTRSSGSAGFQSGPGGTTAFLTLLTEVLLPIGHKFARRYPLLELIWATPTPIEGLALSYTLITALEQPDSSFQVNGMNLAIFNTRGETTDENNRL